MITPRIEKALISGLAKFHTFMMGYTGVAKIIVPARHFIIITDVQIYPFTDLEGTLENATLPGSTAIDYRSTHVLDFFSGSSRNGIIFRNNYEVNRFPAQIPPGDVYIKNSEPVHFDTFFVHQQNVYLSILCKDFFGAGSSTVFKTLVKTQLPGQPVSYGTVLQVMTENNDRDQYRYVPTSFEEAGATLQASGNQPFTVSSSFSRLVNPAILNRNFTCPLINVSYVSINEENKQDLIG